MTILNFFDNMLLSDHGVGICMHPKSIQETDGEVETDREVETVLYQGVPFGPVAMVPIPKMKHQMFMFHYSNLIHGIILLTLSGGLVVLTIPRM
jgi:hypothetical protein